MLQDDVYDQDRTIVMPENHLHGFKTKWITKVMTEYLCDKIIDWGQMKSLNRYRILTEMPQTVKNQYSLSW